MGYEVGIDLGTTYTAAAVARDGRVEVANLGNRAASVPSVIFLKDDDSILTGDAANRRGVTEPDRIAREFKRRVGDPTPVMVGDSPYSAEALTAKLLRWTVDTVTEREGAPPDRIAVTHPANWGPFKHDLLEHAVRLAGLDSVLTLTEPEAAAIYYATVRELDSGSLVAVYDLGGGTFDAAVLRKEPTGWSILGRPEGIERLGGIDFDQAVFTHVRRSLPEAFAALDPDDSSTVAALARIRSECVEAKEALSTDTDASISVTLPTVHTEVRLTRAEFEAMIRPILQETTAAMARALASAGVRAEDLAAVLLIGGASRMPLVAQLISQEFGRPVAVDAHPKHAVALGAAVAAGVRRPVAVPAPGTAGDLTEPSGPRPEVSLVPGRGSFDVLPIGTGAPADDAPRAVPPVPRPGSPRARRRWVPAAAACGALALLVAGFVVVTGDDRSDPPSTATITAPAAVVGTWRPAAAVPTARQQVAAASVAGTVWLVGGLEDDRASADVEGYDPAINTWKGGPALPAPLHHASAVGYRDELVVLGGWSPVGTNLSASVSGAVYALRAGQWTELPPLLHPRAGAAAVTVDDRIVVVGGQAAGALVVPTEIFDGERWTEAPPLPTPREHVAAAVLEGQVYVVGGRALSADANADALERFDTTAGAWERLAPMPTPRGGLGAAAVEGRILAVGGEHSTGVFDAVEAYDPATNTWEAMAPLPTPRHGLGVVAVGSTVYALGGGPGPTHRGTTDAAEALDLVPAPPSTTVPGAGASTAAPVGPRATISGITVEGGRYVITYQAAGFTPLVDDPGAYHVHFFWDTLPAINAGTNGPDPGRWLLWDTPFTVSDPFFAVAARPEGARQICVLIADNGHRVADVDGDGSADVDTASCVDLPPTGAS